MIKHILKNTLRNTRRSVMILTIISLSVALVFLTYSYLQVMYWGLRTQAQSTVGQIQIATQAYWNNASGAKTILTSQELSTIVERLKSDSDVARYSLEIGFGGLVGNDHASTIASGVGIVPGAQGGAAGDIVATKGHVLTSGESDGGLVGAGVATALGAKIGSWLSIMAQTVSGAYNAISFRVSGIVTTGSSEQDKVFVALPIGTVRELLGTEGAERVLVFFTGRPSDRQLQQIQAEWNRFFNSNDLPIQAKSWKDLATYYFQIKAMYDVIFSFLTIVILLLVFLSVFEIISMAFFERTREIGTLRAIGNTKGEIFALLCGEVILLYLVGLAFGLALGFLAGSIVNSFDVTWFPPGANRPVPFFFFLRIQYAFLPALVLLAASVVAGIVPAIHTSRLNPTEVLRYE